MEYIEIDQSQYRQTIVRNITKPDILCQQIGTEFATPARSLLGQSASIMAAFSRKSSLVSSFVLIGLYF